MTFVTIGALLALFIAAVVIVQVSVRHAIADQESVRRAESLRALTLRLQIDEETGLRGFVITGERGFLRPFEQARRRMAQASTRLRSELSTVAPALVPLAIEDRAINARWVSHVALPALAHRSAGTIEAFELRGKSLIDRYREVSAAIASELSQTADARDHAAALTVTRILDGSIAFGLVLAALLAFYARAQMRLGHELIERDEEYERVAHIATLLQEAFLAEPMAQHERLALDVLYAPAVEGLRVGGDWYDVRALADGRVYFSIGDVAGHGVDAAVAMARMRQTIFALAAHENDPSIVLSRANKVLCLQGETMVTACCGFVDPATLEVSYACAGHPPPLLVGDGGDATFLPASGLPLGAASDPATRAHALRVEEGSMLVLYTDGVIEFDHDVISGERALREAAGSVARGRFERPARAIVQRTLGTTLARDDIALVTIRFVPTRKQRRAERIPSSAASVPKARAGTTA
ncbi:MAG: PP2C family protein-serine/threonine phosphatase [Candidatus Tyrphobacter sp.]